MISLTCGMCQKMSKYIIVMRAAHHVSLSRVGWFRVPWLDKDNPNLVLRAVCSVLFVPYVSSSLYGENGLHAGFGSGGVESQKVTLPLATFHVWVRVIYPRWG